MITRFDIYELSCDTDDCFETIDGLAGEISIVVIQTASEEGWLINGDAHHCPKHHPEEDGE